MFQDEGAEITHYILSVGAGTLLFYDVSMKLYAKINLHIPSMKDRSVY